MAVVLLLGLAGWYAFSGRGAGLLPEGSWGPWREKQQVEGWSVRVRVNSWSEAAEAYVHMGKAEDFTMKAYGMPASATTLMDPTRFALTPDGEVTGQRLEVDGPG
ncbi:MULTISPECIES: hypothetical protein [unclassified Streptomyces]|uniref:hypothetical protein n=1 Tax=unclassified Streptomyces TaxID=2593676 RepID=UPI00131A25E6|nr:MULTISPECIES: hypothetical protein [unclassified Streptomyces]MYT31257.1 hypothetical protein [Streptomyces sp. SID8354]